MRYVKIRCREPDTGFPKTRRKKNNKVGGACCHLIWRALRNMASSSVFQHIPVERVASARLMSSDMIAHLLIPSAAFPINC